MKPIFTPLSFLTTYGWNSVLPCRVDDDVRGQEREVGSRERAGTGGAAVGRGRAVGVGAAAAVLHPQELGRALVELVVADAGDVEPERVHRLDGRLVVERRRRAAGWRRSGRRQRWSASGRGPGAPAPGASRGTRRRPPSAPRRAVRLEPGHRARRSCGRLEVAVEVVDGEQLDVLVPLVAGIVTGPASRERRRPPAVLTPRRAPPAAIVVPSRTGHRDIGSSDVVVASMIQRVRWCHRRGRLVMGDGAERQTAHEQGATARTPSAPNTPGSPSLRGCFRRRPATVPSCGPSAFGVGRVRARSSSSPTSCARRRRGWPGSTRRRSPPRPRSPASTRRSSGRSWCGRSCCRPVWVNLAGGAGVPVGLAAARPGDPRAVGLRHAAVRVGAAGRREGARAAGPARGGRRPRARTGVELPLRSRDEHGRRGRSR